jgi:hypothetical protein
VAPGTTVDDAQILNDAAQNPLTYTARPVSDSDSDGLPDSVDNCPTIFNPDQSNTPIGPVDNGPDVSGDDVTNPYEDRAGNACDNDTDNDGLADSEESDSACPYRLIRDSDGDGALDGYELSMGNSPCDAADRPPPGAGMDSDGDGLSDGLEMRGWGTDSLLPDSDGDGCDDDKEVASVNDDRQANISDVVYVARAAFGVFPCHPSLDLNRQRLQSLRRVLSAHNSTLSNRALPVPDATDCSIPSCIMGRSCWCHIRKHRPADLAMGGGCVEDGEVLIDMAVTALAERIISSSLSHLPCHRLLQCFPGLISLATSVQAPAVAVGRVSAQNPAAIYSHDLGLISPGRDEQRCPGCLPAPMAALVMNASPANAASSIPTAKHGYDQVTKNNGRTPSGTMPSVNGSRKSAP